MTGARFSLIVFDMDGVLTDSSAGHARAFAELWSEIGVSSPPAYAEIMGRPTEPVVREFTSHLNPAEADIDRWVAFKQERARRYLNAMESFPDALPTVAALHHEGVGLALGTGASRRTADQLLAHAGLAAFFPVVVTGDDVRLGKPAPETFTLAIERSGGKPDSTLVIEDSLAGLAAGLAAGAWAASVRTGEKVKHDRFIGAFPDLAALLPLIRSKE